MTEEAEKLKVIKGIIDSFVLSFTIFMALVMVGFIIRGVIFFQWTDHIIPFLYIWSWSYYIDRIMKKSKGKKVFIIFKDKNW